MYTTSKTFTSCMSLSGNNQNQLIKLVTLRPGFEGRGPFMGGLIETSQSLNGGVNEMIIINGSLSTAEKAEDK